MPSLDEQIRLAAFDWVRHQAQIHDQVLDIDLLRKGFIYDNQRIPLVGPQGIFKPAVMELPLTITTVPKSRYEDAIRNDGLYNYKYRGENINNWDNVGLRECMRQKIPLIYFLGLEIRKYFPIWPAFVVGDEPKSLTFIIEPGTVPNQVREDNRVYELDGQKQYSMVAAKARIHQKAFRERVLYAYRTKCTLCKLGHSELLDAAHILPDSETESKPIINNGLALCKLHHAAFDKYFIGISPDYDVEVRQDLLDEEDGPMLQHGLKGLHSSKIYLPRHKKDYPNKNFLDIRYQRFRDAS